MPAGPLLARLTAALLWLLAGGCWVAQLTVSWTSAETFSLSSFADGVALVRGGGVGEAFSAWQALALVALPVIGVLLAATAGAGGRVAVAVRALLTVAGAVLLWRLAGDLADGDLDRFGDGARWALAGLLVAVLALVVDVVALLLRRRAPLPRRFVLPLVAACLVLGLVGAVHLSWQTLARDTGADTPAAAAQGLVEAVVARDAVAALRLVAPDEVADVVDRFEGLRDRMGGGGGGATSVVDAVSIEVDPATLELDVEEDGDRATAVVTGGDYRISLDYAELPGAFASLSALFPDGEAWTGDLGSIEGPLDIFVPDRLVISTVRVDGRWYVTGVGTAIEQVTGVLLGDDLATPDLSELPGLLLERLLR